MVTPSVVGIGACFLPLDLGSKKKGREDSLIWAWTTLALSYSCSKVRNSLSMRTALSWGVALLTIMVMACLSGIGSSDLTAMVRHLLAYVRKSSSGFIFSDIRSKSVGGWYVRWLNCEMNFAATVSNEARSAADKDVNQPRASPSNDLWKRWTNMA